MGTKAYLRGEFSNVIILTKGQVCKIQTMCLTNQFRNCRELPALLLHQPQGVAYDTEPNRTLKTNFAIFAGRDFNFKGP